MIYSYDEPSGDDEDRTTIKKAIAEMLLNGTFALGYPMQTFDGEAGTYSDPKCSCCNPTEELNMKLFHLHYDGKRYPVFAANHESARRWGTMQLVHMLLIVEPSKVAVVDPEIAAGYAPTQYTDVTAKLHQHTQAELEAAGEVLTGVDIWAGDFA